MTFFKTDSCLEVTGNKQLKNTEARRKKEKKPLQNNIETSYNLNFQKHFHLSYFHVRYLSYIFVVIVGL